MIIAGLKLTIASMVLEDVGLLLGISFVNSGNIEKAPAILFCMAGVLVIDSVLFFLAQNLVLPPKFQILTEKMVLKIQDSKYKSNFIFISIVLSRFTPGLRYPTALTAGHIKIPFLKFILVNILAVALWDAVFIYLGVTVVEAVNMKIRL